MKTKRDERKSLGAFYTDSKVADFLVWWAIREAHETVLDPSFGGGVFLRSAAKRILTLGGAPQNQVFGIELEHEVHSRIASLLRTEFGIPDGNLTISDFFKILPTRLVSFAAVVGNPPFIRYQRFTGAVRQRALKRAEQQGLKLSELANSWLPFLIHSMGFLRPTGRLAMVIPFEIAHALYAVPALKHLRSHFGSVTFLTFRRRLFPDLNENTILLLADKYSESEVQGDFYLRDLEDASELTAIESANVLPLQTLQPLSTDEVASGKQRLISSLITGKTGDLYRQLRDNKLAAPLGELADVGIGYVTGANDFFHFDRPKLLKWKLPESFLRRSVRRGRSLTGLRLTHHDWSKLLTLGEASYLLELPPDVKLPEPISCYLRYGKRKKVHTTFKCRTRKPWYHVPHVYVPDAFLSYMSGGVPRLVANDAGVVAPNSLHILRLRQGIHLTRDEISALWQTSLTRLSVEIEGHPLGGGMLKLEPSEAEQVLLPLMPGKNGLKSLAVELDHICRSGGIEACREHADQYVLRKMVGLSEHDVCLLRDSADLLRERRMPRSTAG